MCQNNDFAELMNLKRLASNKPVFNVKKSIFYY